MTLTSRPIVMSEKGIVVSGHHRASEAGADILRRGGNAFDAAVACATTLAVAIPNMNGLGGDAIALAYVAGTGTVHAINGSGKTPAAADVEEFKRRGLDSIPQRGPLSMTVCGVAHAWNTLLENFGTMRLAEVMEPAIGLAGDGVPLDTVLQAFFSGEVYAGLVRQFPELGSIYGSPAMRPLGSRIRQSALANSLRTIASHGVAALYHGDLGRILVAELQAAGSLLTVEDFSAHETLVTQSVSVGYRQSRLHAAPPNSQGIALAYLCGLQQAAGGMLLDPAAYMRLKEVAFEYRDRFAADPRRVRLPDLENGYFEEILCSSGSSKTEARAGGGDTSTLVVVDQWGNAVSWVQSLFEEFGSGVLSPSTGIVMHNRMYLEEISDQPTRGLRPKTRPFHTLCPALLVGDNGCELAIATPGDHGQPQAIFQVMENMFARAMNVQAAIEAPRLRHDTGADVMIESRAPEEWWNAIQSAGYTARDVGPWSRLMGGVNAIVRHPDGLLLGGADPRRASYAVCA